MITQIKYFDQNFKTRLWKTIVDIENSSLIEIVVVVKPRSETYMDISLWCSIGMAFLAYTFMMFVPIVFGDYLVYVVPIIVFSLGLLALSVFSAVQRLFIRQKRLRKSVEIMARALFQKGGIRHTKEKIGTLIHCSLFEQIVYVLPDRGAETAIPAEEWEKIKDGFQQIFSAPNPAEALLIHLKSCQPIFSAYIPPVENDINELPDNVEIEL